MADICNTRSEDQRFLVITSRPAGFFSLFFQVVGQLHQCEGDGTTPVVFFRDDCLFWEEGGWNGSRNPWEYYFEPVSDVSIEDLLSTRADLLESADLLQFRSADAEPNRQRGDCSASDIETITLPENVRISNLFNKVVPTHRPPKGELRRSLADLIRRRIVVRPEVLAKVDSFAELNFSGRRVLGVHMRGAEHSGEIAAGRKMSMLPPFFFYREIDRYLSENADAMLFLATDSRDHFAATKGRYGERLVAYDAVRSDYGRAPHTEFGGAKVGEDVLVDALLMARADFLIHGISEVPYGALVFAPDLPHIDVYEKYRTWAKLFYVHKLLAKEISHQPRKLLAKFRARSRD